jgi:hypothetical protein
LTKAVPFGLVCAAVTALAACVSTPVRQIPPRLPEARANVMRNAANGGRVQSIAVDPFDSKRVIIANQFGGMWLTYGGGSAWFRIYDVPQVYVTDVAFSPFSRTAVAAVFRDNSAQGHGMGGLYVSRTKGESWARPPTGEVPGPDKTSAYSVSAAPDERGVWYAGTDYGVAVSRDDAASWTHRKLGFSPIQSVVAFPGGSALAMDNSNVWRTDDYGASWRSVISDNFMFAAPTNGNIGAAGNKMDRAPDRPWAFIAVKFAPAPTHGSGKIWFYEMDTGVATPLAIPQGRSRGQFFRITPDGLNGGDFIRVWLGTGWDGYYVNRNSAADIRALKSTDAFDDWVSFIAEAGIHADMGDLGVDGGNQPAFMGSDGGIFKPREVDGWWKIGGNSKWMSAAEPGSGLNSLQISDLHGTNFRRPGGAFTTNLYFTTQDNQLYMSDNGGATWRVGDGSEGFGLEGREDAAVGESAQLAFIGTNTIGDQFADATMAHKRRIARIDENGTELTGWQNTTFVSQAPGATESNWIRRRVPYGLPKAELYFSNHSGNNWRKFATLNFKIAGEVRTSGDVAWTPVFLGGAGNPIGLLPVSTDLQLGETPPVYDDSDVVRPPGGSLGQSFTEFEMHAIYAADPTNWRFVIAPDITANDVKMTRDGGLTWYTSNGLTAQVRRGGALNIYGGKADLMGVTHIAFDPYHPRRIFVGTRDAGISCSADGGQTWRTIYDSDKIHYITGIHFTPVGGAYVSSYGQGLWQIDATGDRCPKTYSFPWDRPGRLGAIDPLAAVSLTTTVAAPARPLGKPEAGRAKLMVERGEDNSVYIAGRNLPANATFSVSVLGAPKLGGRVKSDEAGQFAMSLPLPDDLEPGTYRAEVSDGHQVLTFDDFRKPYGEDDGDALRGEPDR